MKEPLTYARVPSLIRLKARARDMGSTSTQQHSVTKVPTGETRRPAGLFASSFALFTAVLWGGNNVSIKVALNHGSPMQIGWIRFVLGAVVTIAYMAARRESFSVKGHEIWPLLAVGLMFSVQLVFMNVGQDLTTAGHGVALHSTMPIWAATISQLFIPSDRMSRWRVIAMALSYAGVLVVVFGDAEASQSGATVIGDVLSLISAVLLGARTVMISVFAQSVSEAKLMLGQLVIGTVLLLGGSYLFETPVYTTDGSFWFALAYQGFVIAGFGFLATAWLLKHYLPSTVTFYFFAQPIAGVTLAWLILGEDPGRGLIAGVVLVCIGALLHSGESFLKAKRMAQA